MILFFLCERNIKMSRVSIFLLALLHMTYCGSAQRSLILQDIDGHHAPPLQPVPPVINAVPTYPPTTTSPPETESPSTAEPQTPPPMRSNSNYTLPLLITFQADFDVIIEQRAEFETTLKTDLAGIFRVPTDEVRINDIYRGSVVVDMDLLSDRDLRQDATVQSFLEKPMVWLSKSFRDTYNITGTIIVKLNDKRNGTSTSSATGTRLAKLFMGTIIAAACLSMFGL